jgi:hypothetical protein
MNMNNLKKIVLMLIFLASSASTHAQISGALNELKNKLDKATKDLVPQKKEKTEADRAPAAQRGENSAKTETTPASEKNC